MNDAFSRKQKWLPSLASLVAICLLVGSTAIGQESLLSSIDVESSEPVSLLSTGPTSKPAALSPEVAQNRGIVASAARIGQVVNVFESCGRALPIRIRPDDDVWLVSARQSHLTPCDLSLLRCSRLTEGAWQAAKLDELVHSHSTDKTKVTMIYAHGNRTELKWAKTRGLQFYKNGLNTFQRPPLRFVIFAWRSESEIVRVLRDFEVKSNRSVKIGETLSNLLCQFEDRKMVIAGYSLGAQVVLAGLSKPALQLQNDRMGNDRIGNDRIGKYRVAVLAPALNPVFIQSDLMTLSQNPIIQRTEVFLNRRDRPIKISQAIVRRRTNSNFSLTDLGCMSPGSCNPITIHDITNEINKRHSIVNYSRSTCVGIKLAELLNATFEETTWLPAMIGETIESEVFESEVAESGLDSVLAN